MNPLSSSLIQNTQSKLGAPTVTRNRTIGKTIIATTLAATALTLQGCGGGGGDIERVVEIPNNDLNQISRVKGSPIAKEILESSTLVGSQDRFDVMFSWNGSLPALPGDQKYTFSIPDSASASGFSNATLNPDGSISAKITTAQLIQTGNYWRKAINLVIRAPDGTQKSDLVPVEIDSMPQVSTSWYQGTSTPCVVNERNEVTQFEVPVVEPYDPSETSGKFAHIRLSSVNNFEMSETLGSTWTTSLAYNTGVKVKRVTFRVMDGTSGIPLGGSRIIAVPNDGKQNGYPVSTPRFIGVSHHENGEKSCHFEY